MTSTPVRFRPEIEVVRPDENETIKRLSETFETIVKRTSEDGHAVHGVHPKSHGILEGTLTIDDNLQLESAEGLFAQPGRRKVYMRLSTNAGDILPDTISLPRGLALKVVGVDGERLPDAEGATKDFVMVNGKLFQAKTADAFLKSLKLLAKTTNRIEGVKVAASTVLRGVNNALTGQTIRASSRHPNAIRETVRREMHDIDGQREFRVQLCRDLDNQPVEDPTVEWNEDEAPFARVGIIHAEPQDSWAHDKVEAVDEGMRFSVWTGLAAHQPLGNINRARKAPYHQSAAFRQRFNKCPIHEPADGGA